MSEAPIKENRMGTAPILPLLLKISLPMVISMMVQALYNVVDSLFVAQLSENALTAVSMAFPVQNLMIAVAVGTGIGVSSLLSKRLGEKNHEAVTAVAGNSIILALFSYLLFLIFGLLFTKTFFDLQTQSESIRQYGYDYLGIVTVFSFGIFGQICFERLLQATGKTLFVLLSHGVGAIINIMMDPILIFGWGPIPAMGVAGAAIATVLGQVAGWIFAMVINRLYNTELRLRFRKIRFNLRIIGEIYKVGFPSIIMQSIGSVMTLGMNNILGSFNRITPTLGDTAIATFGVYFKLQSFVFMPVFGFNNGLVPIVAYNYGARRRDRLMKAIKWAMVFDCGYMLLGSVAMLTIPKVLLSWFDASPTMLSLGVPALRIIACSFVIAAFCIVCSNVFQALGNGVYSMIVSIARQLVVLLPCAFLLASTHNVNAVWLAFPIAEVMSLAVTLFFFHRIYQKRIKKIGVA